MTGVSGVIRQASTGVYGGGGVKEYSRHGFEMNRMPGRCVVRSGTQPLALKVWQGF